MAKNPGHRPRKATPEQVDKAVDQMLAEYEATGDIGALDDTRLMELLNISPGTLERYYQGRADKALDDEDREKAEETGDILPEDGEREYSTKERYSEALKRLIAYRRRQCVRHIASGGASTTITGWIFLSKQPHWGGFQDVQKQERTGVQEFRVTISGPDGKAIRE